MIKVLDDLTLDEKTTLTLALKNAMIMYKELLEQDDYGLYREEIANICSIFEKMGYDMQEVKNYISGLKAKEG